MPTLWEKGTSNRAETRLNPRASACSCGVDFGHELRCPHPQPDATSMRLSARVRLPAKRSGSRLSVVHPGPVPYSRRARGQGTTSGRGEELQRVLGRSIRAKVRSVFCRCSSRMPAKADRMAARFEKLASYWPRRGDLPRAALARRNARLHRLTAQFERDRRALDAHENR